MAALKSICEVAYRQVFPNPSDEAAVTVEEFIETGRSEYAYQMLLMYWKERREEGFYDIPSNLLSSIKLDVKDNRADISQLGIFRGFPSDIWLQNVGGIGCKCKYVKTTVNMVQLTGDDDSLPDEARTFLPLGQEIIFPQGVHENPITIVYTNMGENVDGDIEIDDTIAAIVRTRLNEIYLGKIPKEDVTNNSSSDN
jgi:hypothetical protein